MTSWDKNLQHTSQIKGWYLKYIYKLLKFKKWQTRARNMNRAYGENKYIWLLNVRKYFTPSHTNRSAI